MSELAVYRPSNGTWYYREAGNATVTTYQFGASTDIAVPGNYDTDSLMDFAVFRPSTGQWHIMGSTSGYGVLNWGLSIDTPVPGDFDGDGKSDPTVYRPTTGDWYVLKSSTSYSTWIQQVWGNYGDQPAAADYDGDGKTDFCIWRPTTGVWHLVKSSDGSYDFQTLGVSGDFAIPSAYTKQVGGQVSESALATARLSPKNATGGTNLYSQNFGWGTSLAGLSGRAGLDAGFGMSYNSLVWTKDAVNNAVIFDTDDANISPGFRFGFPVIEPAYFKSKALGFAHMMVTPDGGRIEFRQTGVGNTYETADSSYAQLVTSGASSPNDPIETVTIIVTTTDGTQMSYEWKAGAFRCQKIMDRNGNYITINHDDQGLLRTVTDTLGRVITVNYDAQLYPTTITQTWKTNNGEGSNTTHTWATFSYTTTTINTNFSGVAVAGPPNGSVLKVLQKVTYADNSFTQFDYNGYGQVWKVRNVAADSTSHVLNYIRTNLESPAVNQTDCPRFTETRSWIENFNPNSSHVAQEVLVTNTAPATTTYNLPGGITGTASLIEVALSGHPDGLYSRSFVGASGWQEGLPIATEDCIGANCSDRKRWSWTNWTQDDVTKTYIVNPRVTESKVGDTTNTKRSTVEYRLLPNTTIAEYSLVSAVNVYDTDQTTVLKRSETDYNLATAYTSRRIIGLPAESRGFGYENGSLPLVSKLTYLYDDEDFEQEPNQNISNVIQHDTNYNSSFITGRANLTSTTRHDVSGQTANVTSRTRYDIAGSIVAKLDPLNRKVAIDYADNFNDTTTTRNTFAYPTTLTDPANNSSTVKYRFDIGANVRAQSPAPAGNTTGKITERIFDSIGRLQKDLITNTGAYARYEYPDNGVQSKVFSTIVDTNNNNTGDTADEVMSESWSDGAGRVRMARVPHTFDTNGTTATWAGTLTEYDVLGRVKRSTVPTEINSSWNPTGDDYRGMNGTDYIWLWNSQEYDWKSRVTRTIPSDSTGSDGKDTLITYEGCGCAGGQMTTVQGPLVPRDDQPTVNARRMQRAYEDILGRTFKTESFKWDGNSVYMRTETGFNGRNQATQVEQTDLDNPSAPVTQITTMTYDGHARLKTKHIPQQDTNAVTNYNYNIDDSISNIIDARGAATNYAYNSLGLVNNIGWTVPSGSGIIDPVDVTFGYNNLGQRISMTDGLGSVAYSYNELLQMTDETRTFTDTIANAPPSGNFRLEYTYALNGQLKSIKDPYGQQTNYSFDKVGRLDSATGSVAFAGITTYASSPGYRAFGGLKSLNFGNGTSQSTTFNNRLQADHFELRRPNQTTIIQRNYEYLADGNLKYLQDQIDNRFDRLNTFDSLGRPKAAKTGAEARGQTEPYPETGLPYRQSYGFNAFSNMTQRNNLHWGVDTDPETLMTYNLNYTYQNNRITNTGFQYDADGRLLQTSMPDSPLATNYDARGKIVSQNAQYDDLNTQHGLDGDGREVKRIATNIVSGHSQITTKYFIRSSVLGKVVTEYSKVTTQSTSKIRYKSYVHAAGAVLAYKIRSLNSTSADQIRFEHLDVTGMGYRTTNEVGAPIMGFRQVEGSPAETDPMGGNVGVENPYPDSPPEIPEPIFHNINSDNSMFIDGQKVGCYIDGTESSCSLAQTMLSSGSGIEVASVSGHHTVRNKATNAVVTSGAFIVNAGYGVGMLPVSMLGPMGMFSGRFDVNAAAGAAAGWSNVANSALTSSAPTNRLVLAALGGSGSSEVTDAGDTSTVTDSGGDSAKAWVTISIGGGGNTNLDNFFQAASAVRDVLGTNGGDNNCARFFGGLGGTALNIISNSVTKAGNAAFSDFGSGKDSTGIRMNIQTLYSPAAPLPRDIESGMGSMNINSININTKGPFVSVFAPRISGTPSGTLESRVVQLLHEMGHIVFKTTVPSLPIVGVNGRQLPYKKVLPLLEIDGDDSGLSKKNTEKMMAACKDAIKTALSK